LVAKSKLANRSGTNTLTITKVKMWRNKHDSIYINSHHPLEDDCTSKVRRQNINY